jgi:hypothetical protein
MVKPSVKERRWTCPACGRGRETPYCAQCGEEPLRARDLTTRDLATQLFNSFTSVDGRLLRSFRLLFMQPGALTVAHVRGARRAYLGPLQLFLIANALFFGMQSLTHTNILSSPLASHLHHQDWSALANRLVAQRLAAKHMTLGAYSALFDAAVKLNAKSLIILMVLAFTPFVAALFYARHRPIGAHLVFSLHLYVVVLVLYCLSLVLAETSLLMGGRGLDSPTIDAALTLLNLAICAAYLFVMLGVVHEMKPRPRAVSAIVLAAIITGLVPGYRFVIFLVTLYTT